MKYGASSNLLKLLKKEDSLHYWYVLRLKCTHFDDLLKMVNAMPKKDDTEMRMAMPVAKNLFTFFYIVIT